MTEQAVVAREWVLQELLVTLELLIIQWVVMEEMAFFTTATTTVAVVVVMDSQMELLD
jgi:hypothetical protein